MDGVGGDGRGLARRAWSVRASPRSRSTVRLGERFVASRRPERPYILHFWKPPGRRVLGSSRSIASCVHTAAKWVSRVLRFGSAVFAADAVKRRASVRHSFTLADMNGPRYPLNCMFRTSCSGSGCRGVDPPRCAAKSCCSVRRRKHRMIARYEDRRSIQNDPTC